MRRILVYLLLMLWENFRWNLAYVVKPCRQSRNTSTSLGQNLSLICEFMNPVDCVWYKNGMPVDVANRYRYISSSGRNTACCSIEIVSYKEEDEGSWLCLGNADGFEDSTSNAVPPNRTTIVYNGESFMDGFVTLKIPKNVPCEGCLICIAENANPAANLHWELDGIPFTEHCRQSVNLTESGCYTTKLFFDGDLRRIADSSNLSCIAQHANYTLSTSVFVELQKPLEWRIPAMRIVSMAVLAVFLALTAVAFSVCLYVCSKNHGSNASPLIRARSMDNWTTRLSTKALLPEPLIINYDPDEVEVIENPSLTSDFGSGTCMLLPDDNTSTSSSQHNNQNDSPRQISVYLEIGEPVSKIDFLDFSRFSTIALLKDGTE